MKFKLPPLTEAAAVAVIATVYRAVELYVVSWDC